MADLARYYFDHDSEHEVVAMADTHPSAMMSDLPYVAIAELMASYPPTEHALFIAPSDSDPRDDSRLETYVWAVANGYELVSYVSSRAAVAPGVQPGRNGFILERAHVQPWVTVGDDVTILAGSHVGHETAIGDHVFIADRCVVSGNVSVGSGSYIGPNSAIRNSIELGEGSWIGPGVTLRRSTVAGTAYGAEPTQRGARA